MKKRAIKYIAIHCTASQPTATVQAILRYWKDHLGWKNPGYHLLIEPNGTIHRLLPFNEIANGVRGFNQVTIHISYIGGITKQGRPLDNRTEAQKKAILDCIHEVIEWSDNKELIIQGHRDFPNQNKACPCFDAKAEYRGIV
jgi:N-acetylmuramoyl-L-alanine amidase